MRYKRFYDPNVDRISVIVSRHILITTRSVLYSESGFYFIIEGVNHLCTPGELVTLVQRPDRYWDVKR